MESGLEGSRGLCCTAAAIWYEGSKETSLAMIKGKRYNCQTFKFANLVYMYF